MPLGTLDIKTPEDVQAVALQAREAYARGEVELVQRRTGKNAPFENIAVKKREKRVPLVNSIPWQVSVHKPEHCAKSGRRSGSKPTARNPDPNAGFQR
jgi:hypothetical protein